MSICFARTNDHFACVTGNLGSIVRALRSLGGYKMRNAILRRLAGPGLIFTGSAIGTSHLVQSTRAGAMFGVALLGVIVLSTLLKYPACACGDVFRAGAR